MKKLKWTLIVICMLGIVIGSSAQERVSAQPIILEKKSDRLTEATRWSKNSSNDWIDNKNMQSTTKLSDISSMTDNFYGCKHFNIDTWVKSILL